MAKTKKDKKSNSKVSKWWLAPSLVGVILAGLTIFYYGLYSILEHAKYSPPLFKILFFIIFISSTIGFLCSFLFKNNIKNRYPTIIFFTLLTTFLSLSVLTTQQYDYSKHVCLESKDGKCIDWRDAEKCELDPNEEGCVCDAHKNRILGGTIYRECLQAHEATECDLENPNYIKDIFGCRKKTIHDFSCDELLMYELNEDMFCVTDNTWRTWGAWVFCSEWVDPKEEYLLRCK